MGAVDDSITRATLLLEALGLFPSNGRKTSFSSNIRRFCQPMQGRTLMTHPTTCSFSSRCSRTTRKLAEYYYLV